MTLGVCLLVDYYVVAIWLVRHQPQIAAYILCLLLESCMMALHVLLQEYAIAVRMRFGSSMI